MNSYNNLLSLSRTYSLVDFYIPLENERYLKYISKESKHNTKGFKTINEQYATVFTDLFLLNNIEINRFSSRKILLIDQIKLDLFNFSNNLRIIKDYMKQFNSPLESLFIYFKNIKLTNKDISDYIINLTNKNKNIEIKALLLKKFEQVVNDNSLYANLLIKDFSWLEKLQSNISDVKRNLKLK